MAALPGAVARAADPASSPSADEINAVVKTLEDQVAREQLITQLKILAQVRQGVSQQQEPTLGATSAKVLKTLSEHIASSAEMVLEAGREFAEVAKVGAWLERQITDPSRRDLWLDVIQTLALGLGSGYLALSVTSRLLLSAHDALGRHDTESRLQRMGWLFLA